MNSSPNTPSARKNTVAVCFGGPSQEHDVSVVTAQQVMDAMDHRFVEIVPVYLDFECRWFTGPTLRRVQTFRPRPPGLRPITFHWGDAGPSYRVDGRDHRLDCVLPAFHGPFGEDGRVQAYFEMVGVPVTGFSATNSGIAMRKDATKTLVANEGVNVLRHVAVGKSQQADVEAYVGRVETEIGYPAIVKPCHLGSSIGVGLAKTRAELVELVELVLGQDSVALIEPQVRNLVEYNVALIHRDGATRFSAIERPKTSAELLDFKEKYLSSGGGAKGSFLPSEGMLSLTREINPDLPPETLATLYDYARKAFEALGARGAPRIDFLCDGETGEIWFNEINPIPGSYGFFLWEAAPEPMLFPELLGHLVEEAIRSSLKRFDDPVPQAAYLLPR